MTNVRELMRQERLRRAAEKSSLNPTQSIPPTSKLNQHTHQSNPSSGLSIPSSKDPQTSSTTDVKWPIPKPLKRAPITELIGIQNSDPPQQDSSNVTLPHSNGGHTYTPSIEPEKNNYQNLPSHTLTSESAVDIGHHSQNIPVNQKSMSYPPKVPLNPLTTLNSRNEDTQILPEAAPTDLQLPDDFFDSTSIASSQFSILNEIDPSSSYKPSENPPHVLNSSTLSSDTHPSSLENDWEYEWIEPDVSLLYEDAEEPSDIQQGISEDNLQAPVDEKNSSIEDDHSTLETSEKTVIEQLPMGELYEVDEMKLYQTLDTAYHSNLDREDEQVEPEVPSDLPVGFFDDQDADAEARGLEGPKKRRQKEMSRELKRFSALVDVQIMKSNISQEISDLKTFELTKQEDELRHTQLEEMLNRLKSKKSTKNFGEKKRDQKPLIVPIIEREEPTEDDDEELNLWRSKTLI